MLHPKAVWIFSPNGTPPPHHLPPPPSFPPQHSLAHHSHERRRIHAVHALHEILQTAHAADLLEHAGVEALAHLRHRLLRVPRHLRNTHEDTFLVREHVLKSGNIFCSKRTHFIVRRHNLYTYTHAAAQHIPTPMHPHPDTMVRCMRACVRACVRACEHTCMHARMHACVRAPWRRSLPRAHVDACTRTRAGV